MLSRSPERTRRAGHRSSLRALALVFVFSLVLTACGGDDDDGAQIDWQPGTPPPAIAGITPSTQDESVETAPSTPDGPASDQEGPPATTPDDAVTADDRPVAPLSAQELQQFQPNELGIVPILEWHVFTTDPEEKDQFTRPIDDFRGDLEWLYEHNFYVIPLRDLFLDQIDVPAGKHPVAFTFDDSTVGQFRYLIADDGSVTIDPDSAVGVMEAFYAEHPDFGRGGWFAALPTKCFDWQESGLESDQTPYCEQKLTFLIENGYEVGNHTLNHTSLEDIDDETFMSEIAGAIEAFQEMAPGIEADIFSLPYGIYPGYGENEGQMAMLDNGFEYEGREIALLGTLLVGAEPASSPISTEWNPDATPRIQVFDSDEYGSTQFWFSYFEENSNVLYTSDGNPNTITIPTVQPPALDGTFDPAKAEGKEVIEYDL